MMPEIISPTSDDLLNLAAGLIFLVVAISAMIFGRPVERAGGWFLTLSLGLHLLSEVLISSWSGHENFVQVFVAIVDFLMFAMLALKSHRLWPILASGALLLISTVKLLEWMRIDIGGFGKGSVVFFLWSVVILLLAASLVNSRLRQKFGNRGLFRRI